MKSHTLATVVLFLITLAFVPGCGDNETGPSGTDSGWDSAPSGATGTLRLLLTDLPLEVQRIDVAISRVDAVPAGAGGPFTVVEEEQSFDLLTLEDVQILLGEAELPAGSYSQLRLIVTEATITTDEGTFDIKIPSGMQTGIKVVAQFTIGPGAITTILLDFDARESVVERGTGKDRYLLKPVIHVREVDINHAPIAVDDFYEIAQDSTLLLFRWTDSDSGAASNVPGILANDYDPDGDSLDFATITQVTPPANGIVGFAIVQDPDHSVRSISASYQPFRGYIGTDILTYTVDDEHGVTSNEATVTFVVGPAVATGSVVGTVDPSPDSPYAAAAWLLDTTTAETVTRASIGEDGAFHAVTGERIYDLVLISNGYEPLLLEDISVTAGETTNLGALTLTAWGGIYVWGQVCPTEVVPAELRLLDPVTGDLVFIWLISPQSTGIFGFTLPEGTYDLILSAEGYVSLTIESVEVVDDGTGMCHLTAPGHEYCFHLYPS